jgi:hypothetical protein
MLYTWYEAERLENAQLRAVPASESPEAIKSRH